MDLHGFTDKLTKITNIKRNSKKQIYEDVQFAQKKK